MMFLIRAAFWLAVVSVFVPSDFAGDAFSMPVSLSETRIDAEKPVNEWCENNSALCDAGREAMRFGGFLTEMATDRIETALLAEEAAPAKS
ncbi:MAG: hypothetical protein NXI03_03760 [Alphaproteobacteria bacterium]|uniref:hypothetical protein n=1 Tax=Maricaulis alexandrii TaxID=2570354 RepID=UPI00110934BA|nr:hypothetical protein [Maricaulis alexandrii]MCR9266663.1 hypothetical protein [Alphaproteobacteria bacterium]